MELPIALESALKALLSQHAIFSWKISFERDNLAVILRLRQHTQQSERHSGVHADTVSYKRKTPCQINRDKRRADEFRPRRESVESATMTEKRVATESEKTFGHELNTETPIEDENKKSDGGGEHTSGDSNVTNTEPAARGREDTEAAACDESGGHGSDMETETETNSDSDTDTTDSETECDQSIKETAENFVKIAKNIPFMPDNLKQIDRNNTFEKVVCDWRIRQAPRLLCISNDIIASYYYEEEGEVTRFHLRENDRGSLSFWHYWAAVDQDGDYKGMIDKTRNKMKEIMNRVRKMI